jgi:hypothetical protein
MGLWAFHTFIRSTDIPAIENALKQTFALDGFEIIPRASQQHIDGDASKGNSRDPTTEPFWGVFILPAVSKDENWSYLKCVPNDLLCKRSRDTSHPRLAEVAWLLEADAFRLEVEDGDSAVLLECRHDGEFRVSGALTSMLEEAYSEYDIHEETEPPEGGWESIPIFWYEEQVQADDCTFELLSDLQPFNPDNYRDPEIAANEIEAEFLGLADDDYLDWIFYDRLYPPTTIEPADPNARELYFHRRS